MKQQETVVQIDFIDRLGLGYEVFEVLNNLKINLIGMEAKANHGMMIKLQYSDNQILEKVKNDLANIKGVQSVSLKDQMPYEHREDQLTTILDSVSEGIIAVNADGVITHINEVAIQILYTTKVDAVGKKIEELIHAETPILETLKTGKKYSLKEIKINKENKFAHYLASGTPVINEKGQIIGAVATIKDYKQVQEIVSKVDRKYFLTTFDDIIFQSSKMRYVIDTAKLVAKGDSSILLRGESGTGKELFARAIHMESSRMNEPFIAVNCAALPESLLESELFGYEEGAFTGASKGGRKGLFEQAHNGTLFLDEIGEISLQMQVRLLRALQESRIRRIGGHREVEVNVRIITATHQNLEKLIEEGLFREDLYYRLNVIPLRIPPLRERPRDIPLIAQHLSRKIAKKLNKSEIHFTEEAIEYLISQKWPGNVRQLENTLERIINVINGELIDTHNFYDWNKLESTKPHKKEDRANIQIEIPKQGNWPPLKYIVGEVEKQVLLDVLKKHNSSRKAGKVLGVSNTTILNKIKTYGITIPKNEDNEY